MFDFEESNSSLSKKFKNNDDEYDLDLGIALSKSLVKDPGLLILTPEEVQKIVTEKIKEIIK